MAMYSASEQVKRFEEFHIESVKRAHESGVKIAMGTDALATIFSHGENAFELECLVEIGLSPMEAIVAATRNAAEAIGLEDETGTLEEGKLADIIIVDGDPLRDIKVFQDKEKIQMVIKIFRRTMHRAMLSTPKGLQTN